VAHIVCDEPDLLARHNTRSVFRLSLKRARALSLPIIRLQIILSIKGSPPFSALVAYPDIRNNFDASENSEKNEESGHAFQLPSSKNFAAIKTE
jgi:hypothetical protein